ncbi:MAG: DUF3488 and transglutaminase-like domain-containing protein [Woeseiaceae bacterium]|nr:DUF3488 and transglutaminase-like domain-containing protein [Woeseiaceae bacterium]
MAKARGTDGSLLHSLPWTMASLAIALLPHVPYLPFWVTIAFIGCSVWRYSIETRRAPVPSTWFRAFLAMLCFLGILATYDTISGVGPGSALLATMAALKILETRRLRDQFVLLFIAIFLVMSSLLREQYLWSLPYLVATLLFIMTAWLRMSGNPRQPVRTSFRTSGRMLAYAAPIAIAMWILFPRISTPFWSVPIDTSSGVTGLSDRMSPGDISSLSLSNAVAFRARFDGPVPAGRDLYWRALVLPRFNGRSWAAWEPTFRAGAEEQVAVRGDAYRYQVTLEPTNQQWVPALEVPYEWDLDHTSMGRMQTLNRVYPIDQRMRYTVESFIDYRAEPYMANGMRRWFLGVPEGSNPRTAELAQAMHDEAGSDQEFIRAVLRKFHEEEFFYTLEPPQLGSDPVDGFLFDTRRGFCEHYASAFSVMMRSVGIPSRIVIGYQGGEYNPRGEYLIVRQADAHAWTEVWFEGIGWQRVDPTAAVAPERIEMGIAESMFDGIGEAWGLSAPAEWLHQATLAWDALNARWNEWVLGYGPTTQEALMNSLGMEEPSWRKLMLTLVAVVAGLTLLLSGILMLRFRPPPKDRATVLYRRFVKRTGVEPRRGETPDAFAARIAGGTGIAEAAIAKVTSAYLRARYAESDPASLDELETAVRAAR